MLVAVCVSVSLTVVFVQRMRRIQKEPQLKKLTTLQLLMTLEDHGVMDIFVSDGWIVIVTATGALPPPAWLVDEYDKHRDDLKRQLRRVRILTFTCGVTI
jgi:predicted DNA-binding transcriptional regulator